MVILDNSSLKAKKNLTGRDCLRRSSVTGVPLLIQSLNKLVAPRRARFVNPHKTKKNRLQGKPCNRPTKGTRYYKATRKPYAILVIS